MLEVKTVQMFKNHRNVFCKFILKYFILVMPNVCQITLFHAEQNNRRENKCICTQEVQIITARLISAGLTACQTVIKWHSRYRMQADRPNTIVLYSFC
jgi:hypothetical protein